MMNKNEVLPTEEFHYKGKEDVVWKLLNLKIVLEMWLQN